MNERRCVICDRYLPDSEFEYAEIDICRTCGDDIFEDSSYVPPNPTLKDYS